MRLLSPGRSGPMIAPWEDAPEPSAPPAAATCREAPGPADIARRRATSRDIPTIEPPVEWRLPAEHGGWPVVQFHEGDWGPGGGVAPDSLPGMAGSPPPRDLPVPCPVCGCPFCWSDLAGGSHCCECVAIPSRRMAREAWQVVWVNGAAAWRAWEPRYWRPFAHLEAAEQQRQAGEAKQSNGGF